MIYVVIACHFCSERELCDTTVARLKVARDKFRKGDRILVTGAVPFVKGGPTLAELMKNWLVERNFPATLVSVLKDGVGTFSEARIACKLLKNEREITVVSSPWYFLQGKIIWRRRAKERGIKVSFISVPGTGGWRTWITYALIGTIVRGAVLAGLERVLENRLTASQEKRHEGFTFNGCK